MPAERISAPTMEFGALAVPMRNLYQLIAARTCFLELNQRNALKVFDSAATLRV
jgi:hypothetical protein